MTEPFEILIVEDYEPDVLIALRLFQKNRIANRLHVVHDGAEALDFLFCRGAWARRKAGHPQLVVLLDIRLPKVDGWDVLHQLKSNPLTRSIPVVLISGSFFPQEQEKGRELGAIAILSKPLRVVELKAALANSGLVWAMADNGTANHTVG